MLQASSGRTQALSRSAPDKENEMTPETAQFLLGVLNGLTLNVGADDFEQVARQVMQARAELLTIVRA